MVDLMGMVGAVAQPLFAFLVVLTPIVFIHELGHYWVARRNGVRVEVFSIGFGRELFGYTDRAGTRWKFSLIPLGGYVKVFGQNDLEPDVTEAGMSEAEREVAFCHKRVGQRAAIVAAGPIANFILAILIFAITFMTLGQSVTPPRVQEVQPDSPAAAAGLAPGDVFVEVAGRDIARFEEVQQLIRLHPGLPAELVIERDGTLLTLIVTPEVRLIDDGLGNMDRIGIIGVIGVGREQVRLDPLSAVVQAGRETLRMVSVTATGIGQIFAGERGAEEIGGPVRIAQISSMAAQAGILYLIQIAAFLSINLGIVNLLPIPVLDGGLLMFHAYEAIRGRPPGERAQEVGIKIGLVLVLSLMLFATWNDVLRLPWVRQVVDLVVS